MVTVRMPVVASTGTGWYVRALHMSMAQDQKLSARTASSAINTKLVPSAARVWPPGPAALVERPTSSTRATSPL